MSSICIYSSTANRHWDRGKMEQQQLDDFITEKYQLVRVLKNTEETSLQQLKCIETGKSLLRRVCFGSDEVFKRLKNISHPNILSVYEVYNTEKRITVYEEYIDGLTVSEVLEIGFYEPIGVVRILQSLCSALSLLHSKEIIHKDIKPENVMIDKTGTVKLIDFDAARIHKAHQSEDTRFIGTPGYIAPEQFALQQTDARADIFALGIMANVMLTGESPYTKPYNGKLCRIIKKCIQYDPRKRYQSAAELWSALEGI